MAQINLIRIDSRLIHGQVITKWVKIAAANKIVIIDDDLAADSFMSDVYMMAAPKDVKVQILNVRDAISEWNKDKFGNGNVIILFKDVQNCYESYQAGLPMENIQIGGLPSAPGRITILRAISFDKKDVDRLKEIADAGMKIVLHIIPEEPKMEFEKALKKFSFS